MANHTIFSTYVEVILLLDSSQPAVVDFLHVCGGDPIVVRFKAIKARFSPRMWR